MNDHRPIHPSLSNSNSYTQFEYVPSYAVMCRLVMGRQWVCACVFVCGCAEVPTICFCLITAKNVKCACDVMHSLICWTRNTKHYGYCPYKPSVSTVNKVSLAVLGKDWRLWWTTGIHRVLEMIWVWDGMRCCVVGWLGPGSVLGTDILPTELYVK